MLCFSCVVTSISVRHCRSSWRTVTSKNLASQRQQANSIGKEKDVAHDIGTKNDTTLSEKAAATKNSKDKKAAKKGAVEEKAHGANWWATKSPVKSWCNVKHAFEATHNQKGYGMVGMLQAFDIELDGRHHNGIDDCRNIAKVCTKMVDLYGPHLLCAARGGVK
ncbi:unnamed protein product [Amoebophrya sp. A25]|nr:unnamed protein product [Amoebophrya sp. A25]|eukprot:GSA25T00007701001.1